MTPNRFHVLIVGCLLGTSVMEVKGLGLTTVLRPTEILTITLLGLMDSAHHCAHIARHVSSSADFAEEREVVHLQPEVNIGAVYH